MEAVSGRRFCKYLILKKMFTEMMENEKIRADEEKDETGGVQWQYGCVKSAVIRRKPGAGRRSAKSAGPGRTPSSQKNKKPKREESANEEVEMRSLRVHS